MAEAVLALGGNLGARRAIFDAALALLDSLAGAAVLARSHLYETPPIGPPQPDYLNAAVLVRFAGTPLALLSEAQRIELALGRERGVRWGPRTLDIDMLDWSEGHVKEPGLQVPHRELSTRVFALAPLLDVLPALRERYDERLTELGGAPPHAQPGWFSLQREGDTLCTDWMRDDSELASALGNLLARVSCAGVRALSTRAFSGPFELFDARGGSWVQDEFQRAFAQGFRACRVAITAREKGATSGVFVGEMHKVGGPLPAVSLQLERRPDGAGRVRAVPGDPDDGFEFAGSVTM